MAGLNEYFMLRWSLILSTDYPAFCLGHAAVEQILEKTFPQLMTADNHSRGRYNLEFYVCKICFVFLVACLLIFYCLSDWGCSSVVEYFLKCDAQSWTPDSKAGEEVGVDKHLFISLILITSTLSQFWGVSPGDFKSSHQLCSLLLSGGYLISALLMGSCSQSFISL